MWSADDLIVAVATAAGPGARAIVRMTGDGLAALLGTFLDADDPAGFARAAGPPRAVPARLARNGLGRDWGPLPVVVLWWPGAGGPVGGPLAEVQLPGSAPLAAAVVTEACRHGARLARGGEFTLRAFLAGRLDLVQAEAVLGVVDARTPDELAVALDRMAGGAGTVARAVRSALLDLLADVEAAIDFADETAPDAVPVADAAARRSIADRLERLRADVAAAAAGLGRRDVGGRGDLPRVVLVGRPNIGKSSLFNALAGRAAALVADEAGTTRDWLEAPLAGGDGGPACVIVDLAGIADEAGPAGGAEAAAVAVTRDEVTRADVIVACRDAADPATAPAVTWAACRGLPRIDVVTRCDRARAAAAGSGIATSAVDGRGIEDLRSTIRAAVAALPPRAPAATVRLAAGLEACATALAAAAQDGPADDAVAAGHLHRAVAALDEVTGAAIGTDLLDRIFSRHCVGK